MRPKPNVNVMTATANSIPCLFCGEFLPQRMSKNGKPYFVCDPCGVQLFVRRKSGIDRLEAVKKNVAASTIIQKQPQKILEVQKMLAAINGLRSEIRRIHDSYAVFPSDSQERMLRA